MPKKDEVVRSTHARHAVLAAGYSGYCYIPYEYLGNNELCDVARTVKKSAVDEMGQDVWEEDDVDYLDNEQEEEDDDDSSDAEIDEVEEEDESDSDDDDDSE
ncbi:unnamed protein product [Didymodactylos carnosus]|nr:unnamed protein product [Didymodactylos carnosus]CAF4155302.1 unnamed protein product [Didymodactylos carnosus]